MAGPLSYAEVIRDLESRGVMPEKAPTLEPMREALRRLEIAPSSDEIRHTIIVAGTNGKGSISATLEALLLDAGQSVGLYTSPHLMETTERIRVNGRDVSRELFVEAFSEVRERTSGIRLSHFEMLTLMAIWIFRSGERLSPVDWVILEVGLGGTWDATNAIPHGGCVIASLGMDHQNLLGNTLREIAVNKFGVVSPGSWVVHSALPEEVLDLAERTRSQTGSDWTPAVRFDYQVPSVRAGEAPVFMLRTAWGEAALTLPGYRGAQNTATALTAFARAGFDPARHLSALGRVRWLGRMNRLGDGERVCPIYFSGDHNPQGIESLLEILPHYPRRRLHVLLGIGRDKDANGILERLAAVPDASLYLTQTPFKGRTLDEYGDWPARVAGAWADPVEALAAIESRASRDEMILVTGSLYLVGQLMKARMEG